MAKHTAVFFDWNQTLSDRGCGDTRDTSKATVFRGVVAAIRRLRRAGFTVGVLSNTKCSSARLREMGEVAGLPADLPYITAGDSLSGPRLCRKPDACVFTGAAQLVPHATDFVMVGDKVETDAGALDAGWGAVLVGGATHPRCVTLRGVHELTPAHITRALVLRGGIRKRAKRVRSKAHPPASTHPTAMVDQPLSHLPDIQDLPASEWRKTAALHAKQGRKALFVFHATWCGFCKKTLATLQAEAAREPGFKHKVFAVDSASAAALEPDMDLSAVPVIRMSGPRPSGEPGYALSQTKMGKPSDEDLRRLVRGS